MRITLICSNASHPIYAYLKKWMKSVGSSLIVDLVQEGAHATGGDLLILVSCSEIITKKNRSCYTSSLVLHASDLPKGRGWSPHIWELVNGAEFITVSLVEVEDKIDSGRIWKKINVPIPKNSLWHEINHLLFNAEIDLINFAVKNHQNICPKPQSTKVESTYYVRRTSEDSEIDPHKSIADQFDLIRVCDPNRFPAFFNYLGQRYILKLEKSDE
jgi:methionyl-tRNA formyltransferase